MGNREEMVKIYLTEDEKKQIKSIAEKKGLQVSSYGRMQILGEA
jgi:16S rRNA U516 pseudouridylate synthase RsuA-like enzyme